MRTIFGAKLNAFANVIVAKVPAAGLVPVVTVIVPDVSFPVIEAVAPVPALAPAAIVVVPLELPVMIWPFMVNVPVKVALFAVKLPE